jgi:oleate hydratase
VRNLLNATVQMQDGRSLLESNLDENQKTAIKQQLGKIHNTDIEKLLKEYHVI